MFETSRPWALHGEATCQSSLHDATDDVCCFQQQMLFAVPDSRQCLLCQTQTVSAASHNARFPARDTADDVCCVAQQTMPAVQGNSLSSARSSRQRRLCATADIVSCGTQNTFLATWRSGHCPLCGTANAHTTGNGIAQRCSSHIFAHI